MSGDDYVCTLDEASLKVAKHELHEDPINRLGAVDTLRQWIKQQKHLNFTTDTRILLTYLRYAKFSQLKARSTIESYCTIKTNNPTWFNSFNPFDAMMLKALKTGVVVPLPGFSKDGRKRVLHREAAFDPTEWKNNKGSLVQAIFGTIFALLKDERCQVHGFVILSDKTGITMAHQGFFTVDDFKKIMGYFSNNLPGRFKGLYMYNAPALYDAVFALFSPFLSKKLKERFIFTGSNLEEVYKIVDKDCLPNEYLPDDYTGPKAGTVAQLTDGMIEWLQEPEIAEFLALVSHPDWKVHKAIKAADIPNESFRKLQVE